MVHELPSLGTDASSAARVFVLRTSQIAGAALTVPVEIDGTTVVELGSGEYAQLEVAPGPHVITTAITNLEQTRRFIADPKGRYFFELSMGYPTNFHQLDSNEGERKIASGSYERLSR